MGTVACAREGNGSIEVGNAEELRVAETDGLSTIEGKTLIVLVSPNRATGVVEPAEGGVGVALLLACLSCACVAVIGTGRLAFPIALLLHVRL